MARVSSVQYGETLWSELYPGNRHTVQCFQPAVLAAETALELPPELRPRTVFRLDGGAGSDDQLLWLLARGYQVMAKGLSNRRAEALARQVRRWDPYQDCWLAEIPAPIDFGRPVRCFVKRRLKQELFVHSYYISTLTLPSKGAFMNYYDRRGAAEIEQFRNDKSGLNLTARRKRLFLAQMAYILLTDLAHNLLADFHHKALVGSRFEGYGSKRIIRDLLHMPGKLTFADGKIAKIELPSQKQFARELLVCLEKYCSGS